MICPIKTDPKWIALEKAQPELAHYLWNKYEGNVPDSYYNKIKSFDKNLAQKIQNKLQKLYPEIELNITNTPVWEQGDNIFNQEEYNNQVNYRLKATEKVLNNLSKIKQWESNKSIDQNTLWKKIGELGISKQQLELLKESEGNTIEEKLTSFIVNYSYTVEINTIKEPTVDKNVDYERDGIFNEEDNFQYESTTFILDGFLYEENVIHTPFGYAKTKDEYGSEWEPISPREYKEALEDFINKEGNEKPTQYYSNLTVPGGNNYTEQEIATPAIIPSIKGHAQFSTDKGIGWFRSDKKVDNATITVDEEPDFSTGEPKTKRNTIGGVLTKTRRILEVQSDLFQKGRDKKLLAGYNIGTIIETDKGKFKILDVFKRAILNNQGVETGVEEVVELENLATGAKGKVKTSDIILKTGNKSENQFLQFLNKDNNWVTFFVKSIMQDSAKKGYEKIIFPTGNTASKIEGHQTLEEFKKEKENRIKSLEQTNEKIKKGTFNASLISNNPRYSDNLFDKNIEEIKQLKKELERVEKEGFGALKPIYNFYENNVANILKKQGYNPVLVSDEYGNTWNEVNINQTRDLSEVLLQRNEANQIIGQANIKAMTVLIDAINQKQDTLPHEYAHHYIAWFRNTPIVQEAINKWGSEEALVQSIGEQVVKQKGEAYNWWNKFVKWIMNKFNSLSNLQKKQLTQILTDAFLTRQDLTEFNKLDNLSEPEVYVESCNI